MRRTTLAALGVAAVTAVAVAAAPAEAQPPTQPTGFAEVLDVQVVNLEVVVTDRQGGRVRGLGPGDFRLWVDDVPVTVDFFTEVAGGVAVSREGTGAAPAVDPGRPVETSYLVFVDDYFSITQDRDRVLASLRAQLGHLAPQDRMALVAWDGKRLEMLSSWSQSRPALERALGAAAARPALGLQRLAELHSFTNDRGLVRTAGITRRNAGGFRDLEIEESHYAGMVQQQVERSVGAVAATLRAFASPPGRKVLILLSGGWPSSPAEWATSDAAAALHDGRFARGAGLFTPVVETANLLGYTVYAVDVPGMGGDIPGSAEHASPVDFSGIDVREQALHHTLSLLSEPTGGKALLNSRRGVALEEVALDTRSYYWLGFTSDRAFDGSRHRVRVEVTRPGLRLRYRDGYQDFTREREVTMAVESALLFGSPSTDRTFPLQVGAARRAGMGRVELPLALSIPVDALTFLPTPGGGWTAEIDLRVAVLDDGGATSPVAVVPLVLTVAEPPEPGSYLGYTTSIRLRRDRHDMVVALHEPAGGAFLTAALSLDPR